MVTFAQAQERAEEWINGDVPSYQHREVRVREFELGFVVWAEDRAEGPRSDGGAQRLVIARDSGEATLWPSLPVGEVIRRYEEEYGLPDAAPDPAPAPPARVDLNQTSFLLTPPEWLQEAADRMGIPNRREGSGAGSPSGSASSPGSSAGSSLGSAGSPGSAGSSSGSSEGARARPAAASADAGSANGASGGQSSPSGTSPGGSSAPGAPSWPAAGGSSEPGSGDGTGTPPAATPWAGTDTNADAGEDRSVPLPATVFSPPLSDADDDGRTPPPAPPDAKTAMMHGGSRLPRTAVGPAVDDEQGPGTPGTPPPGSAYGYPQGPPGASAPGGPQGTPPPGAPGTPPPGSSYGYPQGPGAHGAPPPGAPGTPSPGSSYGYPQGPGAHGAPPPGAPGTPPPGSSHGYPQAPGAAPGTPPPAGPGAPQPPAGPNAPQPPAGSGAPGRPLAPNAGDIADAATSKAQSPPRGARGGGATTPPPPGAPGTPGARPGGTPQPSGPGAPGASGGGGYVPTQLVSQLGSDGPEGPGAPGGPGAPQPPGAPNPPGGTPSGGVHHQATVFADPNQPGASSGGPRPPGPPGAPGRPGTPGTPPPGAPQPPGGTPSGGVHHAATMLSGPGPGGASGPGAPQPPGAPGTPGTPPPGAPQPPGAPNPPGGTPSGGVHHAQTMLSGPGPAGPATPPPPQAPGMPPGAPQHPTPGQPMPGQPSMGGGPTPGRPMPGQPMPGQPMPGQQPPAYGYPQQGQPTVGPGYQAVLRYRAQDGSEQQLIRRSAPGTPHPEWQILHELRAMNVPPQQVLELHTELESCELPGAYCARMIRESWPQARITSIAPYGTDHASRQQGMAQLIAHQGELHQVADGPARPAPVRAPLPPVQPTPPIPPEAIGQELAAAFGPGIFRFDQAAVSRQGVPPVVAHTLVVAGLPVDMNPFFWAQAQPGRPVPTLAELAQERGVQPASDAGSYLVMGSDFGKAICVQYGTANIVAVPVEAGPGGASVPPQFVNTGLPEFARSLALLGRMWRLRFGLNQEQAGRWTVDFQAQLAALDPAALGSPESWWSVLLEQMWDGLL
ncbi:SUKH-4 family immunity protein [Streptomyces xiangluensis]|uniref:SUKH-4 family immunity protein n=1 Tax=Streptomyces xiangluensis TaxID=2665720 RepID=A0ABV8YSG5_9ACTN